ncbi:uncharacterized protein LOC132759163 [Ruditapes philippinarum]|uniref:uncharacterized protein LOC132759163 n=1 Tax=Ruditapes philippinarum TaxID=129788 RepID=UPI00295B2F2A|nr:uncharacterized protein LOC132759163 [Ruditapes philippinarum]
MEGDLQVMSTGTVCGESSAIATSIIRIDSFTISMAQGIALTFNVPLDGDGNVCLSSDQYIMSDNYAPATSNLHQGNRWKFSSCSVDQFKSAFSGGLDLSCLQVHDSVFDFDAYEEAAYISELLTVDEQCVLRYEAGSTFCDDALGNTVDCYSSTQGCTVSGSCSPFTVPQLTPCDTGETAGNYLCSFGFCISIKSSVTEESNSSTSTSSTTTTTQAPLPPVRSTMIFFSSSLRTTSSTQSTTTNADALQTTTGEIDCTPEISYEYYNLPGCSCSGCNVKNEKNNDDCLKSPDCIGKKVRVATRIIPESCISLYQPGPRRVILTASEAESTELNAEVFKGNNGKWKVELVKNP